MQPETVLTNVAFPAGIAFSDDGTMYFTEREGRVRIVTEAGLDPEPLAEAETTTAGETGFLGIAVSPLPDGYVYFFATDPDGASNKVFRISPEGGEIETVLEDLPGGGYHNGGGLTFDDSGALFVSNGEIHDSGRSQDPMALGGKVYRVTPDGEPLNDNPFGVDSMTYALGLRNPYGIAIDPVSGDPFVTENGPSSHDEVNHIVSAGNYGWPAVEGAVGDPGELESTFEGRYRDPLLDYPETVVPTGIAFADPATAAARYRGDLFFGTYGQRAIHRVQLDGSRQVVSDSIIYQETDPVIAVAWGPRGLYYSTPSAIKVLPLAKDAPSALVSPPGPDSADPGVRTARVAVAVVLVAAAGVAVALWWRKERGRA